MMGIYLNRSIFFKGDIDKYSDGVPPELEENEDALYALVGVTIEA